MKYIIDTNIFMRASAVTIGESGIQENDTSRFDVATARATINVPPATCRGLIIYAIRHGWVVPTKLSDEIGRVVTAKIERREFKDHNISLANSVHTFLLNTHSRTPRPFMGEPFFKSQYDVGKTCTVIAEAYKQNPGALLHGPALWFLKKGDWHPTLHDAKRNFDLHCAQQRPTIWDDWYFCYAAMVNQAKFLSFDQDVIILNEAFDDLYNYKPALLLDAEFLKEIPKLPPEEFKKQLHDLEL